MSVRALTWSFNMLLRDMAAKGVLNALADHADEEGRCWPSIARLALCTGCDEKTARRALGRLVELGLVEREPRAGKSDVFWLRLDVDLPQEQPLPETTPAETTTPNEAHTPPTVTVDPSQPDPDPSHGGSRTIMNRQETVRTRAVRASAGPDGPPRTQLPDSAKWAERLAGYRPWEGVRTWHPTWGLPPDSAGHNPLIPTAQLRAWRILNAEKMAELKAGRIPTDN